VAIPGVVGFLGFGNMGEAIARGLVRARAIEGKQILAYDVDPGRALRATTMGGAAADSAGDLARRADTLLLAPKPQDMRAALHSIRAGLRPQTLVVSIAAGISIGFIQRELSAETRVVRAMPNTPALVGAAATGFAPGANCTAADKAVARGIFEAIGIAEEVAETQLDAVTALSGSGPAYYFAFVEASTSAAIGLGIPADQAGRLAAQTLYGAGLLLHDTGEPAGTLRERVTSKGGTTAAALATFAARDLAGAVRASMEAAAARSKELGQ
jgi:pyrroline-5-carboxylate reductase